MPAFYGFRGEMPGTEGWRRADYGGFAAGLRCMRVALRAGVAAPPGEGVRAARPASMLSSGMGRNMQPMQEDNMLAGHKHGLAISKGWS